MAADAQLRGREVEGFCDNFHPYSTPPSPVKENKNKNKLTAYTGIYWREALKSVTEMLKSKLSKVDGFWK